MKKCFLSIFILLCSCTLIKPKTANRAASVTLTNTQQTDSIMKFSSQISDILRAFVFLDKNFRTDSLGNTTLADTIYVNAIIVKGKVLYIGMDTLKQGN